MSTTVVPRASRLPGRRLPVGRAGRTRVGLVEDQALTRMLLERELAADPSIQVVHSASGAQEARLVFDRGSCDVGVLAVDLADGNGISLGLQLQRADPELAVVLLTGQEDVTGLLDGVQDQATRPWSFLSKRSPFTANVLAEAVRAAGAGHAVIDPYVTQVSDLRDEATVSGLTAAQMRVLRQAADGLANAAIADRLEIGERSVESHLMAIYRRLGIDRRESNPRVAAILTFLRETGRMIR